MGMMAFVIGVAVSALVVLGWLGSIVYVRRWRTTPSAPLPRSKEWNPADEQPHSIEAWLARAAALPAGQQPEVVAVAVRDQRRLQQLAARHFPELGDKHPQLHLVGVTEVEKRLLAWVNHHTGLPDPFDALDELTGDPDELSRITTTWLGAHSDILALADRLSAASDQRHNDPSESDGQVSSAAVADYLAQLHGLAADVQATAQTLRGLQAEAALAEGTIAGLINLLIGSFGGYLVESVLTAGTLTPAVAAQAQVELTWVIKQVAVALERLGTIYSNARHILQSVIGFKDLQQAPSQFQPGAIETIEQTIDTVG
jgi:malonyl CoA-acyl carrier protein transacylase